MFRVKSKSLSLVDLRKKIFDVPRFSLRYVQTKGFSIDPFIIEKYFREIIFKKNIESTILVYQNRKWYAKVSGVLNENISEYVLYPETLPKYEYDIEITTDIKTSSTGVVRPIGLPETIDDFSVIKVQSLFGGKESIPLIKEILEKEFSSENVEMVK